MTLAQRLTLLVLMFLVQSGLFGSFAWRFTQAAAASPSQLAPGEGPREAPKPMFGHSPNAWARAPAETHAAQPPKASAKKSLIAL